YHRQRSRNPAGKVALHRRHPAGPAPALPAAAFRMADGCRQPRATALLAALARDLPDGRDCRLRPPFLFFESARRASGETLCPPPRATLGGAPIGGDEAAGLGVLS